MASYGAQIKTNEIKNMPWVYFDEYYYLVDKNLSWMIKEISDSIIDEINEEFDIKIKTHYHMCSGNYTYFFLTPKVLNVFQREYPCTAVHIKLFEFRDYDAIADREQDCLFTSRSVNKISEVEFMKELRKRGYGTVRGSIVDASYFCASKDAVEEKAGKNKTLQEMDLLYGRIFKETYSKEEINHPFSTKPVGRENEDYLIISDGFYLSHLFMLAGVGIWITFDSASYDENVVKLAKIPGSDLERYCIFKNGDFGIASKVKKCLKNLVKKTFTEEKNQQIKLKKNRGI